MPKSGNTQVDKQKVVCSYNGLVNHRRSEVLIPATIQLNLENMLGGRSQSEGTICVCPCMLSCLVMSNSLQHYGPQSTRLLCLWNFPGKNTRVGCHAFLQEIFSTWRSNLRHLSLLCYRPNLYCWTIVLFLWKYSTEKSIETESRLLTA